MTNDPVIDATVAVKNKIKTLEEQIKTLEKQRGEQAIYGLEKHQQIQNLQNQFKSSM